MYHEHFGLKEAPFPLTPHTEFFFSGANRGATLDALIYAITHDEGIVKVSGEVGSGKTMLCRMLMERLPKNVDTVYIADPTLTRQEIVFAITDELGLDLAQERSTAVVRRLVEHLINLYAQGRRIVLLIDEAHAMPAETLEQIRLLSNLETRRHKLLQIVLFGQPELHEVLDRPQMRQLKDRITQHFTLDPLRPADVAAYIAFRMRAAGYRGPNVFKPAAIHLMASASSGLTRRLNVIADKALLAAYALDQHEVTPRLVRAAIRDAELRLPSRWRPWALAGGVAVLALAAGMAYSVWRPKGAPAANPAPAASPTRMGAMPARLSTMLGAPADVAARAIAVRCHDAVLAARCAIMAKSQARDARL